MGSNANRASHDWSALGGRVHRLEKALDRPHWARNLVFCRPLRSFEYGSPADPHVRALSLRQRANRASRKLFIGEPDAILRGQRQLLMQHGLAWSFGPCRMAYLSFCSPARLLRHTSRHRERTITIPIMATPSFMPNQMESNVSIVHHLSQRAARQFVPDTQSPVEHPNHEGPFWKKRWYLGLSVNGCSTAFESLRILANALDHPGT